MTGEWIFLTLLFTSANAANIRLQECFPPDVPEGGDYGPKHDTYQPGDTVLYFCDTDSWIGGHFLRKCEDTGKWTGNAPVCDSPSAFSSVTQTSTADDLSEADNAFDGRRDTCSSTNGVQGHEWYGVFQEPGELIRVMLFLPKGRIHFQVILVKENGAELSCGSLELNIVRHDWTFQNCPGPNNVGAKGVKIRSLSGDPIRICEIQAYVLTSPKCTDPHVKIENGYLILSRKRATLECDSGYFRGRNNKELQCIREGEWDSKHLFCADPNYEEPDEIPNRRPNPERERERIRGRNSIRNGHKYFGRRRE